MSDNYDLLDKLFFFVRTPEEGVEMDDMGWVARDAVSNYARGWESLQYRGLVELDSHNVVNETIRSVRFIPLVRFTKLGLEIAISRNISPKVREQIAVETEAKEFAERSHRYESNPIFGTL